MIQKAVVLLIGLVFLVSVVDARPIVKETDCGVLAPDGINFFIVTGKEVIKTDKKVTITCSGTLPAEISSPDRAVNFDYASTGIIYDTDYGLTDEWKEVITPSGHFKLKIVVSLK